MQFVFILTKVINSLMWGWGARPGLGVRASDRGHGAGTAREEPPPRCTGREPALIAAVSIKGISDRGTTLPGWS